MATRDHLVNEHLSSVDRVHRVDGHTVLDCLGWDFLEGSHSDKASVQEEHCNVDVFERVTDPLFVVADLDEQREVKHDCARLDAGVLLLELGKLLVDLCLGPRNDANVEALSSHLVADFETDSVRTSSDHGPGVFTFNGVAFVHVVGTTQVVAA